jgi:integrase
MSTMPKPWKHPKSGIYYHRIDVPKDIRHIIGKTSIKKSLNTNSFSEAKRLFAPLYAETQALFAQARNRVNLTPKDIEILSQRWLKAKIEEVENGKAFAAFIVYESNEASSVGSLIGDALESGYHAQIKWVERHIEDVLTNNNLLIEKGGKDYRALTEKLCWRLLELSRLSLDRYSDDWSTLPSGLATRSEEALSVESANSIKISSPISNASYKPLSEVIKSFIAYKTQRGDWDAKTLSDVEGVCGQLMEYVGANANPSTITREQLREFSVLLSKLPNNYARTARFKGMTLLQLAELSDSEDIKTASDNTVKKKFVFIKALFKYAEQEEWVDKDRAKGITIVVGEVQKRLPFTNDELAVLFTATSNSKKPSDYWMPRISLTTGMRSNEILQLTKKDVRQVSGVWVFDINQDHDEETGLAKKVKRDNSKRLVPIPDVLIRSGFLDFVSSLPNGRLFSCVSLGADGAYSSTYGKIFNALLKDLGLKPPVSSMTKLDLHSLRHTFRANSRAFGVPSEMADLLGGWKDQGQRTSGDEYGLHFESFIQELKRNIDKIDYGALFD